MAADWFRRRRAALRRHPDAGVSAVEMVFLAPLLMLFVLVLVAFGLLVRAKSSLDGAARDAARAGSLERTRPAAVRAAAAAAAADAASICSGGKVTVEDTGGPFVSGGMFTVRVSCEVHGLASLGLDVSTHVEATSTAPLDTFRRTG
ncbi:TadE/TadG family type IV pilus assembly protein [Kitasatospora sp. KL5]|uniref:TadE/TadG family type IV pilus assembly protein n=1 Tax=Kitasatospora sp. KL5 TaxID=3425125 RepID=UPI003D6EC0F6